MEPPSKITGSYIDDYNIITIHEAVLRKFKYDREKKCTLLRNKVVECDQKLLQRMSLVDRKTYLSERNKCLSEIEDIEKGYSLSKYLDQSEKYIRAYSELGPKIQVKSFMKSNAAKQNSSDDKKRHLIIAEYINIAKKYIPINIYRDVKIENCCPGCGFDLSETVEDDNGYTLCKCGVERYRLPQTTNIDVQQDSPYDTKANFLKAFHRHEGTQKIKLPDKLFADLKKYFANFGLPSFEEVKSMPPNPDGTRGNTDREMMFAALSATKNATYYDDVNLICSICWDWELPKISHLEDIVSLDFTRTQEVFDKIPKERKSNLNLQFRLFKHLQMRGYKCTIKDFKMIERKSLEAQEEIWKQMIEECIRLYPNQGFVYIPTSV